MGKAVQWRFCSRTTRKERIKQRKKVVLHDAGLSTQTQVRYYMGLRKVLPIVIGSNSMNELDDNVADWVQDRWEKGDTLYQVSDALCALHHYEPWMKGKIPRAWKLFGIWRRPESPNRAPPLVKSIVYAWAWYALHHQNMDFAAMILLGFFALLRTGECLQVTSKDLMLGENTGIVSLHNTKTGKRNAAREMVQFDDYIALEILREVVLFKKRAHLDCVPIWTRSAQSFRNQFAHHCSRFDMVKHGFRPYSMRRGGATALFQDTGSMESALLKGRWQSTKVAKIYLADGLSHLPGLTFSPKAKKMLQQWDPVNQI